MRTISPAISASLFLLATCVVGVASADDPSVDVGANAVTTRSPPPAPAFVLPSTTPSTYRYELRPEEEDRYLLGPHVRHGGYGAPEMKLTSFTGDGALLIGGQAGWIIDRHLVLGVAGYGLASAHTPDAQLVRGTGTNRIGFGYGGVRLAYTFLPQRIVHLTLGVLVGAGGVTVVSHNLATDRWDSHDGAALFALEPQAELEINVARYFRIAPGLSYRVISGGDKPGLQGSDMSGVAGSLALKIGYF